MAVAGPGRDLVVAECCLVIRFASFDIGKGRKGDEWWSCVRCCGGRLGGEGSLVLVFAGAALSSRILVWA